MDDAEHTRVGGGNGERIRKGKREIYPRALQISSHLEVACTDGTSSGEDAIHPGIQKGLDKVRLAERKDDLPKLKMKGGPKAFHRGPAYGRRKQVTGRGNALLSPT